MADEMDPRVADETPLAGGDGGDAAGTDTDAAVEQGEQRRRVRRSITTGLLPDKMLSGELIVPPASLNDFANAPVRETIPYTADPKTTVRSRVREMSKLYGEDTGTYLNFVVRPGQVSAAFYPREAHLLGESVQAMITGGGRGGDHYIWCERSLSECYIVVVMDGIVRADMTQPQQNTGQEVRQWLFTIRRHLSQLQEQEATKQAAQVADNDEESDALEAETQETPVVAPLPKIPQLFLRNLSISDLGISGSTAARVESVEQDILEWCWDNPEHLYPLLPAKRALRMVFSRESRWLRSLVLNIAGVVMVSIGIFYAWTTVYQYFKAQEIADQLAEANQNRSLLDEEVAEDTDVAVEEVAPETDDFDNLVNRQLGAFLAGQRDAGLLFNWVLHSLLDLGGDVNSDTDGAAYGFHRLMHSSIWSNHNNLLVVRLSGSASRITRLHEVVSNDPDFPYSVRSYSVRRAADGKLDLQRTPAREVPRLNELWLASSEPLSLSALSDDQTLALDVVAEDDLLLLDGGLAEDEDGDGGSLFGGAETPDIPDRQEWLLREWVSLLRAMTARNIRLYEEQRKHYRVYQIRGDIPELHIDSWRWFAKILHGRAILLQHLELSFGQDPQRLRGHIRLSVALPLLVGDSLDQDIGSDLSISPLPKESEEAGKERRKIVADTANEDRAERGRRHRDGVSARRRR